MRNILRVVVLNKLVDFLLFLGKLVIVAAVGCLAYFVLSGEITEIKDEIPTLNYFQVCYIETLFRFLFVLGTFEHHALSRLPSWLS